VKVVAYTDGASRGNPGPSSYGAVLFDADGKELHTASQALGRGTNNQAEYRGAIAALEAALALGASEVELRMDSELIVRQMSGRYRVRNPALIPLHNRMLFLRKQFARVSIVHVPRAQNKVADRLANAALDGGASPTP
jgi:probable phosphoglycerate mutase